MKHRTTARSGTRHSGDLIRHPSWRSTGAAASVALAFLGVGVAQAQPVNAADARGWVGTWSSSQVAASTKGLSATGFTNQTVRDIVHTSVGGSKIRFASPMSSASST